MIGLLKGFKKKQQRRLSEAKRELFRAEHVRYKITYQWRRPGGCIPGANPRDWRSWREFGSLPILFFTEKDALAYMEAVDLFRNMRHLRKPSASVNRILI